MFVAGGLYRLKKRMRQTCPGWENEFLTSKYIRQPLPVVFGLMNLIVLIWGASPHTPGTIARKWWPIITLSIFFGGFLYWAVFRILQVQIQSKGGQDKTIGEKIGFNVIVHNETDQDVPEHMREDIARSRLDGSRRRTEHKVRVSATLQLFVLMDYSFREYLDGLERASRRRGTF